VRTISTGGRFEVDRRARTWAARDARDHPELIEQHAVRSPLPSASSEDRREVFRGPLLDARLTTLSAARNASGGGALRPIGTAQDDPFGAFSASSK
jgi:hypothetical protein